MIEDEAKEKWCPQTTDFSRCIGSGCMAWRDLYGIVHVQEVIDDPSFGPGGKRLATVSRRGKTGGYCGLAGKPME